MILDEHFPLSDGQANRVWELTRYYPGRLRYSLLGMLAVIAVCIVFGIISGRFILYGLGIWHLQASGGLMLLIFSVLGLICMFGLGRALQETYQLWQDYRTGATRLVLARIDRAWEDKDSDEAFFVSLLEPLDKDNHIPIPQQVYEQLGDNQYIGVLLSKNARIRLEVFSYAQAIELIKI